jgi:ring-1,2-phenylacetyl-CoA epoxidase subunit PaaC
VRLGDGTEFSRERMQQALETIWPLAGELSLPDAVLDSVFAAAGLTRPAALRHPDAMAHTGRDGGHTEATGDILAELQSVARAYPDATW